MPVASCSTLDFLAQHFQLQPFLLHLGQLFAQLFHLGSQLVEACRVLGEEVGIGHLLFSQSDLGFGLFHFLGNVLQRELLLVGEFSLGFRRAGG
ncbi:hypothetical protein D3C87_1882670 [compost metagenome]